MARGGLPVSPLPHREGIDPLRLRMPQAGPWATLRDHLVERIPLPAHEIDAMLHRGEFFDERGQSLAPDAPFVPRALVWVYRDPPPEVQVPFDIPILYRDERLVVVDKPHFLATTPRGQHVRETVLTRLRAALDLPELAPAHRLDRLTAGVLVLTTEQRWRGAYQRLFATGAVAKDYLATARFDPALELPATVSVHLAKPRGALQAQVLPDEPANSCTEVSLLTHDGVNAGYLLRPRTGRTHQLRAHCAWLGIPLRNDPLYPSVVDCPATDFTRPLALVARRLAFRDPIDGRAAEWHSCRLPDAWPQVSGG